MELFSSPSLSVGLLTYPLNGRSHQAQTCACVRRTAYFFNEFDDNYECHTRIGVYSATGTLKVRCGAVRRRTGQCRTAHLV